MFIHVYINVYTYHEYIILCNTMALASTHARLKAGGPAGAGMPRLPSGGTTCLAQLV